MKKRNLQYIYLIIPAITIIIIFIIGRNEGVSKYIRCSINPERKTAYRIHDTGPWRIKLQEGFNRIDFRIGDVYVKRKEEIMNLAKINIIKYKNDKNNLFIFSSKKGWNITMGICQNHNNRKCVFRQIETKSRCIEKLQIYEIIADAVSLSDIDIPTTIIRDNKYY